MVNNKKMKIIMYIQKRFLTLVFSFVFVTISLNAAQLENELANVQQSLDKGSPNNALSKLNKLIETPFPYRLCLSNGVCIGWIYFDLKMQTAEAMNRLDDALRAARFAERYLPFFQSPTNSTCKQLKTETTVAGLAEAGKPQLPPLTTDLQSICSAQTYSGMARIARKIGKNYTSEQYALTVISMTNIPESILAPAMLNLVELYFTQARYKDAHKIITNLFDRVDKLPKEAFVKRAQLEFQLGKNEKAFSDLLAVLYTDGLQQNEPWNDPALRLFLIRIARAEEYDIVALYDALKTQLDYEELIAGKEKLLAFLIQERMLLARVFPFLIEEKDLKKLDKRLAKEDKLHAARQKATKKLQKLKQ